MTRALVCPGCRTSSPGRIDVRTLDPLGADLLACECGRRYPILDGIPVVTRDPAALYQREIATLIERDLSPEVAELLVEHGPDDAPYPRLLEHLSTYLDAHWGDRAEPPPDGVEAGAGAILDKVHALPTTGLAVELGCSAGRVVAELAARADHAIGIDLHLGVLRRARKILAGEPLAYARRMIGRHYARATIAPLAPIANTTLVCGDALDPPLVPGVFDRVVALNTLDSVPNPQQLLDVVRGLCAPGGEVILSSPYAWRDNVLPDHHRLGGNDPAAAIREAFAAGYDIEDEADLAWTLRRDARSSVSYRIHYIRARKVSKP